MEKKLTLKIVTPNGTAAEHTCTALRLPVMDDKTGHGGGSYGIHPGHLPAMMALSPDRITAKHGAEVTFAATIRGGIAVVERDTVTVLTDECTLESP